MTVKELVFRKLCEFYREEHGCNPTYDVQRTYFVSVSIADEMYHIGCQKGLSDAQIRGNIVDTE